MGRKRTTRQLLIDRCQANEKHADDIIDNLMGILGTYQESDNPFTVDIASALQTAELFKAVLVRTTAKVRQI